jgi:hypothetical protein
VREGSTTGRGQAFTLEGLVAAIVLLTAVVFALQAIIITPTTGGTVDPGVRDELRQQASDALTVSAQQEARPLTKLVRNWSQARRTFTGAINPQIGYGQNQIPGTLGTVLNRTFDSRDRTYNVEMAYLDESGVGTESTPIARRGTPSDSAVVATYRITMYDNMTLTSPTAGPAQLWQYDTDPTSDPSGGQSGFYPVPNAVPGPVYNIVEIRVIVW